MARRHFGGGRGQVSTVFDQMMGGIEEIVRGIAREEVQAALARTRSEPLLKPRSVSEMQHFSVARIAELLGVSADYVYDRIADGSLSPIVELATGEGRSKQRVRAGDLQRFLDARTHPAPTETPQLPTIKFEPVNSKVL